MVLLIFIIPIALVFAYSLTWFHVRQSSPISIGFLFFVFAGLLFRTSNMSFDFGNYNSYYSIISGMNSLAQVISEDLRIEYGYRVIIYMASLLTEHGNIFFTMSFFHAVVGFILLYRLSTVTKARKDQLFLIYILFFFFTFEYSIIRFSLALILFSNAIADYFFKNKLNVFFILASLLIHNSIIIFLLLFVYFNFKGVGRYLIIKCIIFIIVSVMAKVIVDNILSSLGYSHYLIASDDARGGVRVYIELVLMATIAVIIKNNVVIKPKFFWSSFIALMASCFLTLIFSQIDLFSKIRVGLLFIFLMSYIVEVRGQIVGRVLIAQGLLLAYGLLIFVVSMTDVYEHMAESGYIR